MDFSIFGYSFHLGWEFFTVIGVILFFLLLYLYICWRAVTYLEDMVGEFLLQVWDSINPEAREDAGFVENTKTWFSRMFSTTLVQIIFLLAFGWFLAPVSVALYIRSFFVKDDMKFNENSAAFKFTRRILEKKFRHEIHH